MSLFGRLMPRQKEFFQPLTAVAKGSATNAKLLRDLLADPSKSSTLLPLLHQHRRQLDEVSESLDNSLVLTFIAPIDPEDLSELNADLHHLGDGIDDLGRLVIALRVESAPRAAVDLCSLLSEATTLLEVAVGRIKTPRAVQEATAQVRAIEKRADELYTTAMSSLFEKAGDPIEVLKWKEIFSGLEDLVDLTHRTANLLDRVAMKDG